MRGVAVVMMGNNKKNKGEKKLLVVVAVFLLYLLFVSRQTSPLTLIQYLYLYSSTYRK